MMTNRIFIIVKPISPYSSLERAIGMNKGVYSISRPESVRNANEVADRFFEEIQHPINDFTALPVKKDRKIYIHPNHDTQLLQGFVGESATTEEVQILTTFLENNKGKFVPFEFLLTISGAVVKTYDEMDADGWFDDVTV